MYFGSDRSKITVYGKYKEDSHEPDYCNRTTGKAAASLRRQDNGKGLEMQFLRTEIVFSAKIRVSGDTLPLRTLVLAILPGSGTLITIAAGVPVLLGNRH